MKFRKSQNQNIDQTLIEMGFTLVELLFVVILLSLLGISVMKIITQVQAAKITAEDMRQRAETANRIFLEMRSIFSSRGTGNISSNLGGSQNSYYSSGPRQIAYDEASDSTTKVLRVNTLGSRYANPYLPGLYGEIEARYYLEKSREKTDRYNLIFELWAIQENQQALSGAVTGLDNSPSSPTAKPIIKKNLSNSVKNIQFRFRQQQEWKNEINNNFGIIPNLIEVTLELINPQNPNDSEIYRTALPFGSPLR